jgi:hypothetical protein
VVTQQHGALNRVGAFLAAANSTGCVRKYGGQGGAEVLELPHPLDGAQSAAQVDAGGAVGGGGKGRVPQLLENCFPGEAMVRPNSEKMRATAFRSLARSAAEVATRAISSA